MVCPTCGTVNQPGAKFCAECGTRLARTCASCGSSLAPTAKFCPECGTPVASAPPVPGLADERPPAVPGRMATTPSPPEWVRQSSGAERRLVSVLFADLVGFTALADGRDPEETRELLSRYFDLARDVIERHGGSVEKFIGDAVMAVWGAPAAREDDAERAVRSALELVDAVRSLGTEIRARAGVLTGEAAVTIEARGQGMVAGDLVNTASRLQSAAPPGAVLVGETTMRAASGAIAFEAAGEQALKGKSAPVPAWRALRVVAERGGRNRSEGPEAPFVGRDDELRLLKDMFHATARERRPRLISVVGPAGIGKTRLAWEFLKYVDGLVDSVWWHDGRSPSYGDGITLWALGEMVRARARLLETDDEPTTRAKIRATVREHVADDEERCWIEAALLALLGVEQLRGGPEQLFGAWRTFFERLAATAPVVMVFEDFHFADAGLLDFVDHLMDWSKGVPIYVLTLSRPELFERRPDWGAAKRNFTSVYLEPLPAPAMRRLLAGLVPGLPEAAASLIAARAEGVPLYAVETVRMLVAEGRLVGQDGVYVPVGDLTGLAVPATLQALIASRLDALPPDERTLVSDAAVLGQSFTLPGLSAVSGLDEVALEPMLRSIVRREVLRLEANPRSPEHGQYAFVQALIREVAYGTLAKRDRKVRHLAAARYFESLGSDELAGALAAQYLAAYRSAGEGPEAEALAAQARVALRAAATRAASLASSEQAVAFTEEALTVTTDAVERVALLQSAARWSASAGHYTRAEALARQAIEIAHEIDPDTEAQATALLGTALIDAGQIDAAVTLLEQAREAFAGHVEPATAAVILTPLSRAYMRAHREADAIAAADAGLAIAERLALDELVGEILVNKGSALDNDGRPREALGLLEAGRSLARRLGLVDLELRAANNIAVGATDDDPRVAVQVAAETLPIAERTGVRSTSSFLLANVAWGSLLSGRDVAPAVESLRERLDADPEPADRAHLLAPFLGLRSLRDTVPEVEFRALDELVDAVDDPALKHLAGLAHADRAFASGSGSDLLALADRLMSQESDDSFGWWSFGTRGALWEGDVDQARRMLAIGSARVAARRRVPAALAVIAVAGILALEGDAGGALARYREGSRLLHQCGSEFEAALAGLDMALLLEPTLPEVAAAAAAAREIFQRIGATRLVARIDETLARPRGDAGFRAHGTGTRGESSAALEGEAVGWP